MEESHVGCDTIEHRGCEQCAAQLAAARRRIGEFCTLGERVGDQRLENLRLLLFGERGDAHALFPWQAHLEATNSGHELMDEFIGYGLVHHDELDGRAPLPVVREAPEHALRHGCLEIRIW